MNDLEGKDGAARNWAKLKIEWKSWKAGMVPFIEQYHDAEGIGGKLHKAMNLVTESFRGWPYLWAHIIVGVVLWGIVVGFTWWWVNA